MECHVEYAGPVRAALLRNHPRKLLISLDSLTGRVSTAASACKTSLVTPWPPLLSERHFGKEGRPRRARPYRTDTNEESNY